MRAMLAALLLCGLLAALLTLAAVAQEPPKPASSSAGTPSTEVPLVIPAEARRRTNPLPATEENIQRGLEYYASQCAMCHGARGAGDGDLARAHAIPMPDLRDPAEQKKRTDGELFYILTQGHGRMPAEGSRLPEEYRWSMILALRSFARQEQP